MQLCKFRTTDQHTHVGLHQQGTIQRLDLTSLGTGATLSTILHADDPVAVVRSLSTRESYAINQVKLLAPVDEQEIWAAGVTYIRSKVAREEESASSGASRFYDMVYTAPRPELFFKSPARRVVHPGEPVRIRRDGKWNVPEPEATLVISPAKKIVGFTAGNDMSSRDIEGENPLYLPQAKIYDGSCAVGPFITLAGFLPSKAETTIRLTITRNGSVAFDATTNLEKLARTFEELVSWLGKETSFPDGVLLMTGTGIVPPDSFTLAVGDEITIEINGIGKLVNPVA